MKKLFLIVFCFIIFFALRGKCEASFTSNEILKIAGQTEHNQIAVLDLLKKASSDKTTISQTPLIIENLSTPKTLTVKNTFLGTRQWEPVNAQKVQCLRATDFTLVFCPCHHYISELRL